MHYENDDSYFILPHELSKGVVGNGKTSESEIFSLPQENVNENQVYERGKKKI